MTTPVSLLRAPKMHALKQEGQRYCRAYQTALRVLERNCVTRPEALIQAGGCYPDAWTRDTAYNTWMGCNLLCPELARATLLKPIRIGGDKEISGLTHPAQPEKYDQYWDKMLWTVAALDYAELNRDLNFLTMSYEVSAATLDKLLDWIKVGRLYLRSVDIVYDIFPQLFQLILQPFFFAVKEVIIVSMFQLCI